MVCWLFAPGIHVILNLNRFWSIANSFFIFLIFSLTLTAKTACCLPVWGNIYNLYLSIHLISLTRTLRTFGDIKQKKSQPQFSSAKRKHVTWKRESRHGGKKKIVNHKHQFCGLGKLQGESWTFCGVVGVIRKKNGTRNLDTSYITTNFPKPRGAKKIIDITGCGL